MRYSHFDMLPERAFQRDARGHIKPQGGGGSSSPSKSTVTQTNIPEYARPYAEETLGRAQALTDINQNPYQPYTDQRFAGFSPMQVQAFQNISGQQVAPQLTDASNLAYAGALQGLGVQPVSQGLQQTALGYGQVGAGYGGAASTLGLAGAEQAAMTSQEAQRRAGMFGGMGARYGAMGAQQAGQVAGQAGQAAQAYGGIGAGYGLAGLQNALQAQAQGERLADIYGAQATQAGAGAAGQALMAQRQAERQADVYGQMGAGYGAAATGMAPAAQQYGATAAGIGQAGMGYGAQGAGIGGLGVQAAGQGFGAGERYAQMATSPAAQQAYMSPYMQNVVRQQQEDAIRQSNIARGAEQARAVGQGAFGGSRSAIVEAEMQKNLQDRLADIQAAGSQQAFQQAQQAQQFGANLGIQGIQAGYQGLQTGLAGTAQGMQGAQVGIQGQQAGLAGLQQAGQLYGLGMQGAGLGLQGTGQRLAAGQLGLQGTAQELQGIGLGGQMLGQRLQAGQLGLAGTAQGMQGAGLGLQGVGQQLAAGQLGLAGTAQGIQGAQAGLQGVGQQIAGGQLGLQGVQTGISGQQAGMQGAQTGLQGVGQATGAGQYGLAGAQLGIQGAGQLGQLGGQQFQQEMAITDALQKYGALQQQQQQQGLDFAYQQYLAGQQYPYQQLSYMSDILRGVPSTQSAMYQYQQQPALAPQLLGAGLSAYGAFARSKQGGRVGDAKRYAVGGQVSPDAMQTMDVQQMPSKLRRLSDTQLAAYARSVKDAITLSAINNELERRTKARMPMGGYQDTTVADEIAKRAQAASIGNPMVTMAGGGGIVALQAAGRVEDSMTEEQKAALKMAGIPEWFAAPGRSIRRWWDEQYAQSPKGIKEAGDIEAAKVAEMAPQAETIGPQGTAPLPIPVPAPTPASVAQSSAGQQTPPQVPSSPTGGQPIGSSGIAAKQAQRQAKQGQGTTVPTDRVLSYEEYQKMIPQAEQSAEDRAILDDMKSRLATRMQRAEKQGDNAKYDAIMMAGLAMMGGTSLADGIAKAAQMGGATFMAGKKDADKALTLAEDAEAEFGKYQMALRRDDKKQAQDSFNKYVNYALKLDENTKQYQVGMAKVNASSARGTDVNTLFDKARRGLNADKNYTNMMAERKKLAETVQSYGRTESMKKSDLYKNAETQLRTLDQQIGAYERNYFQSQNLGDVYAARTGGGAAPATGGNMLKFDAQGNLIQ